MKGRSLALLLITSAGVAGAAWGAGDRSSLSCNLGTGPTTTVGALIGAVVQPADLPRGWRFERVQTLPKGTAADGPSIKRLGGAVMYASRDAAPRLDLTSDAELEPSPSAACRVYHRWLHALLSAGVRSKQRPPKVALGREQALLQSNETAFRLMFEISCYRGAVYASVQVQFRRPSATTVARRAALDFAKASDRRIQKLLK